MHRVIVEANSADHNGRSCKVRVMEMGRLATHKSRHINKMPVTVEQYFREQAVKSTFMGTHMIRHNRALIPCMAYIQVNTYHSDKWQEKMPDQQNRGVSGDTDMTDGRQDNDNRHELPVERQCKARKITEVVK